MADDMILSGDQKSLRRGQRRAPRTSTCRPCIVWSKESPDITFQGVVINMTPFGMCVRMLDSLPAGMVVYIQLMRDEEFRFPLSGPVEGMVVRNSDVPEGFMDHGVQLLQKALDRATTSNLLRHRSSVQSSKRESSRMYTIDLRIGDRGLRRSER